MSLLSKGVAVRDIVKIMMLVTADYAAVEPLTNKLNIVGVFRNIAARTFPATHRRMFLVVKIGGKVSDGNVPHKLRVSIVDDSGDEITRTESSFLLSSSSTNISPEHNALIELNGLGFRRPGDYFFKVNVNDGEAKGATVVHVLQHED